MKYHSWGGKNDLTFTLKKDGFFEYHNNWEEGYDFWGTSYGKGIWIKNENDNTIEIEYLITRDGCGREYPSLLKNAKLTQH